MSRTALYFAKRATRQIEKHKETITKFEGYIRRAKEWIKRDKQYLKNLMTQLTPEENLEYGLSMGFIERADYEVMLAELEEKK